MGETKGGKSEKDSHDDVCRSNVKRNKSAEGAESSTLVTGRGEG